MKKWIPVLVMLIFAGVNARGQCASPSNIVSFTYDGNTYEIVKENKTWADAAACAVERGGILAEINSSDEQDSINYQLSIAGINNSMTVAPDGGGASYVWIGGNDLASEGTWIWDGDHDGTGTQFWQGNYTGGPVGGAYTNWGGNTVGSEPDDYGSGQDALGLALTNWPLGSTGQWNDVAHTNTLYFLIEYSTSTGLTPEDPQGFRLMPNPAEDMIRVSFPAGLREGTLSLYDIEGRIVMQEEIGSRAEIVFQADMLDPGLYMLYWRGTDGRGLSEKVMIR